MVTMDSSYRIIFHSITYILCPFSTNQSHPFMSWFSCRHGFYDFCFISLFNNYLATLVKRLGDSTINVHRNYGGFCIRSVLTKFERNSYRTEDMHRTVRGVRCKLVDVRC